MLLELSYLFEGNKEVIQRTCSNYTFGLPMIFHMFHEKHPEGLKPLEKSGQVKDVVIRSYYNGEWRTLKSFSVRFK